MEANRVIAYTSPEEEWNRFTRFRSFRIDDKGIKREGFQLLPWQDVQYIRAWVTAGDGDWGYNEFNGLEIRYGNGYRLRLTDALSGIEEMLLLELQACLPWFLPAIVTDWRQQVWADYQRHYRRQQWLGFFWWYWYPNKPVIYERQESAA